MFGRIIYLRQQPNGLRIGLLRLGAPLLHIRRPLLFISHELPLHRAPLLFERRRLLLRLSAPVLHIGRAVFSLVVLVRRWAGRMRLSLLHTFGRGLLR